MLPFTDIDPDVPETWPDLTFEEFMLVADLLPCPCPVCLEGSGLTTVEYHAHYAQQVAQAWDLILNMSQDYPPPPNSPTNAEMHALNGNLSHHHNSSYGDFVRAAGRGLMRGASEPDRFAASTLSGAGAIGGGLLYTSFQNMAKPLAESYEQFFGAKKKHAHTNISNKESHIANGNYDSMPNMSRRFKEIVDNTRKPHVDVVNGKITVPPHRPYLPPSSKPKDQPTMKPPRTSRPIKPFPKPTVSDGSNTGIPPEVHAALGEKIPYPYTKPVPSSGPTNQEMHSYNGNPPKQMTLRQQKKSLRKRTKNNAKRSQTKAYSRVIRSGAAPFPLNRPKPSKAIRNAAKVDSREMRIARQYASFLKQPNFKPPRIGSTGSLPTKLLRGYYKVTINMAAPGIGLNPVTNCTSLIAYLCPKVFPTASATVAQVPNTFSSPIVIGVAQDQNTQFTSPAGTATPTNSLALVDFANNLALNNESGAISAGVVPPARWLGAAISIECRCPVTTTAPPYLFGGLIPMDQARSTTGYAALDSQLNQFTTNQLRNLPTSVDVPGMEVSSVYLPAASASFNFDSLIFAYGANNPVMGVSPIPYVGMMGCPTTASVTLHVTSWFEIQQTSNNMNYSAGWSLAPKVSAEDVFDHLPKIKNIQPRIVSIGSKQGNFSISEMLTTLNHPPPPVTTVQDEIELLKKRLDHLSLKIDDEEDEKYFDTEHTPSLDHQNTPIYKGLSQSTLDLALSLKKSLTPGSVTNKTIQSTKL